jgi:hypothetical protein
VLGLLPFFNIDNWAHLGGLAAGFSIAYVAGTPVHVSRAAEQIWKLLAIAAVLVTALSFWQVYAAYVASPFSQFAPA